MGTPRYAGVAGREHRVGISDSSVVADVGDRPRGTRLHDVADEPGGRRRARTDRLPLPVSCGGAPDHLVALEQPNRCASCLEQLDGGAHGDVEQVVRVELARQLDAARARAAARASGHAARSRTARSARARRALHRRHGRPARAARPRTPSRPGRRRSPARDPHPPAGREESRAASRTPRPRRLSPAPGRSDCRRRAGARRAPCRRVRALSGTRPPLADRSPGRGRDCGRRQAAGRRRCERSTAADSPPSASAAAWATASSVASADNGSLEHRCDPVETALDLRLARALLVRLGIAKRHGRQAREALDQP